MGLGQVFVFAYEDDNRIPKLERFSLVLFQAVSNDFRLPDVRLRIPRVGICAEEKVDTCAIEFLASQQIIKLGSRRSKGLACPIGNFAYTETLRVTLRQK